MSSNRTPGRRAKLDDPETRALFLETLERTGVVLDACRAASVSESAAFRSRDADEVFRGLWAEAYRRGQLALPQRIRQSIFDQYFNGTIAPHYRKMWTPDETADTIEEMHRLAFSGPNVDGYTHETCPPLIRIRVCEAYLAEFKKEKVTIDAKSILDAVVRASIEAAKAKGIELPADPERAMLEALLANGLNADSISDLIS